MIFTKLDIKSLTTKFIALNCRSYSQLASAAEFRSIVRGDGADGMYGNRMQITTPARGSGRLPPGSL